MTCKHNCANCTCTATSCANYPACGCDDPFNARWPSCIPTAPASGDKVSKVIAEPTAPAPDYAPHLAAGECQFYPECGCADADNCPMH